MKLITIPKQVAAKDDLIVIPRREYETLLALKKFTEFKPSVAQKRALVRAEKNFARGDTLSYHDVVKKLGFAR